MFVLRSCGAPGMTRTCDVLVRSQPTFPNSLIAIKFNLSTKNTPRGGLFSRELTFWFLPRRSVRNSVLGEAWHRLRQVRNEPLPATLPYTWSAKGRQDFGTIANDDATGGQIHCNVSAAPVADGKTTLSIPSEIQMSANSCET